MPIVPNVYSYGVQNSTSTTYFNTTTNKDQDDYCEAKEYAVIVVSVLMLLTAVSCFAFARYIKANRRVETKVIEVPACDSFSRMMFDAGVSSTMISTIRSEVLTLSERQRICMQKLQMFNNKHYKNPEEAKKKLIGRWLKFEYEMRNMQFETFESTLEDLIRRSGRVAPVDRKEQMLSESKKNLLSDTIVKDFYKNTFEMKCPKTIDLLEHTFERAREYMDLAGDEPILSSLILGTNTEERTKNNDLEPDENTRLISPHSTLSLSIGNRFSPSINR